MRDKSQLHWEFSMAYMISWLVDKTPVAKTNSLNQISSLWEFTCQEFSWRSRWSFDPVFEFVGEEIPLRLSVNTIHSDQISRIFLAVSQKFEAHSWSEGLLIRRFNCCRESDESLVSTLENSSERVFWVDVESNFTNSTNSVNVLWSCSPKTLLWHLITWGIKRSFHGFNEDSCKRETWPGSWSLLLNNFAPESILLVSCAVSRCKILKCWLVHASVLAWISWVISTKMWAVTYCIVQIGWRDLETWRFCKLRPSRFWTGIKNCCWFW